MAVSTTSYPDAPVVTRLAPSGQLTMVVSTTSYLEGGYSFPASLSSRSKEPITRPLAKSILNTLGTWLWSISQPTLHYWLGGTDTLTWGDQARWIQIRLLLLSLLEQYSDEEFVGTHAIEYDALLDAIEKRSSFLDYMRQVEIWADAYDQKAVIMSSEELEALYDNAFFEAMELEKKLP